MTEIAQQIEAILFIAGEGLAAPYITDKLCISEKEFKSAIDELKEKYSEGSGVQLIKFRNNYQFGTNPAVANAVATVLNPVRERNLTRAAMETMAIVAYKQPITKLEIDEIRGVASDYAVHVLLENNLIAAVGRKESLGKPILYGTTDEFLKRFELADIANLPSYDDLLAKLKTAPANFDLYSRETM